MKKHRNKLKESLVLGKMLTKLAPKIGASVFLEPVWNVVGQINFKSGKKSYFRYNTLDLNPVGSSDIAKDKDYANVFIKKLGYPIIPSSKTFFSDEWADAIGSTERKIDNAYVYAKRIGFPVVVKPNSGSQGICVAFVRNKKEFYRAVSAIFRRDRLVLIQKPVSGKDYRLVVLDDRVISAYERISLNVIGNGKSTILDLLKNKQKYFAKIKRDTLIKFNDPRIITKLARQKMTFQSIPKNGERVFLLDNANLSSGGDSSDVTEKIHPDFKNIAINLTRDMGLRLCGVDLIVGGDIEKPANKYWVLEINAAPGLDHYTRHGKVQEKIVEDMYLEILKSLDK